MNIGQLRSKYKVIRRSMGNCNKLTEICHFVSLFTDLQPLSSTFPQKNYASLLTESFYMSMTYLQTYTRQIANQPSPR